MTGPFAAGRLEALHAAWAGDAQLAALRRDARYRFLWSSGAQRHVVAVTPESVAVVSGGAWDFALHAEPDVWDRFLEAVPPAGYHDVLAMWSSGAGLSVEGDMIVFGRYLGLTRRLLTLARRALRGHPVPAGTDRPDPPLGVIEPIVGRYVTVAWDGRPVRLYFEESGTGRPVLLLHTAGADSRQYRHQLADPDYGAYRLIAFDLPYHGRSGRPEPDDEPYRLTQRDYAGVVEAFVDALGLDRPVLIGMSMAAQIVLELALRRPHGYRAVVGFGAVAHIGRPVQPFLHHPEVNEARSVPDWVIGLVSPRTPPWRRRELWWHYSQSGAGVFAGDAAFFQQEWDARDRLGGLDTRVCPVHLFAGEYDYSRPPRLVRATAERIAGAMFTELPGCGHFPAAEDPRLTKECLLPILAAVAGPGEGDTMTAIG